MIVASANVAGLRGAVLTGKAARENSGFAKWFKAAKPDLLAMQETKVTPDDKDYDKALETLTITSDDFILLPDVYKKGHAGVGTYVNSKKFDIIKTQAPFENLPETEKLWYSGRWLETYLVDKDTQQQFVFINGYFHHADSPTSKSRAGVLIDRSKAVASMDAKHKFMAAVTKRLRELINSGQEIILVGDVNIAHKNIDIKNYQSNKTKAGFLPEERKWLDLFFASAGENVEPYQKNNDFDYTPPKTSEFNKGGLGLKDVAREFWGPDKSIYTWWTNMGHAFDNDAGWRIDYQITTPGIGTTVKNVRVDKQASYAQRYSDHAPLVIEYLG